MSLPIYFKVIIIIMVSSIFIMCKQDVKTEKESPIKTVIEKKEAKKDTTKDISIDKQVKIDFLMGKFEPKNHPDFIQIENKYASRSGMWLQKKVYHAFEKMYLAAKNDGIKLIIRSATRNFTYQKGIWERKWNGHTKVNGQDLNRTLPNPIDRSKKILEYSSMPGSSRHHWGTDIDLNSFDNKWFESGEGKLLYNWLKDHADEYGFRQVYTVKGTNRLTGYEEEKWHWSYYPISKKYIQTAKLKLKPSFFHGFAGAKTAKAVRIIEDYVLGINPQCL